MIRTLASFETYLSRVPGYERREGQLDLANAIGQALDRHEFLMAEASTGTGKSFAYLLPLALYIKQTKQRAVISTATLNLQDQLLGKDIPVIQQLVPGVRFSVLKGRNQYLCPHRVEGLPDREHREQFRRLIRQRRVEQSQMDAESFKMWHKVTAEHCHRHCDGCPLGTARQLAKEAEIVITNHSLLALGSDAKVLPDFQVVVVDEAHKLVEAFTSAWSQEIARYDVRCLDGLVTVTHGEVQRAAREMQVAVRDLVESTLGVYQKLAGSEQQREIDPTSREWLTLCKLYGRLAPKLERLGEQLRDYECHPADAIDFDVARDEFNDLHTALVVIYRSEKDSYVRWYAGGRQHDSLNAAPLDVAETMHNVLWGHVDAAILLSATLREVGGFNRGALGFPDGPELVAPSPFDYPEQCLLAIPNGAEPGSAEHEEDVATVILELARRFDGRTLGLFTSYRSMNGVGEMLRPHLVQRGIRLLVQGQDGGKSELLEEFKRGRSVLLGTASFWEGIDLIGDQLVGLVIVKLPFDSPNDVLHSARSKLHPNPFAEYSLPRCGLKLKQGFGRLIRSKKDKGVCVLMDSRLWTKRYGKQLIRYLPQCSYYTGPVDELNLALDEFLT